MKKILLFIPAMILAASCSHKSTTASDTIPDATKQATIGGVAIGFRNSRPVNAIPKASAFRMSGDFADNVAVTLNPDGSLAYFPDPSDISQSSRPIALGNGWWLNRQGISANSMFTRYTFAEYSALKKVPSVKQLKASLIPGARVTEMRELPFSINEAPQHLDSIRSFLNNGHPSGQTIFINTH